MVHRCDAERSKISMQEPGVTISGRKIDNSGNRGRNRGLTRVVRKRKVVDVVDVDAVDTGHARSRPGPSRLPPLYMGARGHAALRGKA